MGNVSAAASTNHHHWSKEEFASLLRMLKFEAYAIRKDVTEMPGTIPSD